MLAIYRALLYLYPSAYRDEYEEEMLGVLSEVQEKKGRKGSLADVMSCVCEAIGLLFGALHEHARNIFGPDGYSIFSSGRLTMRSEFRFPKATVTLMAIILAIILVTIDKAKAIQSSIPYANPQVGPIQPSGFTVLPTLLLTLGIACIGGAIGWAILFALHRSGVHRLSEADLTGRDPSVRKLSS